MTTYSVSDLSRKRRQVVDAARDEPVRIRDTDGTLLVLTTEDREVARAELLRIHGLVMRAESECRAATERGSDPNPAVLGELSFITDWNDEKRRQFLDGLNEALAEANALQNPEPAAFYIRWHRPFEGPLPPLVDPDSLARLGATVAAARPDAR